MTVALFDTQHITDIADAIRARTGEGGLMTVRDMPGKISALIAPDERECWIGKPMGVALPGMTVAGHFEYGDTVEAYGFGFDNFAFFAAFRGEAEIAKFQVFPYSRKLQVKFGQQNQKTLQLANYAGGDAVYLGAQCTFTASKDGITIEHRKGEPLTIAFDAGTWTENDAGAADEIRIMGGAKDTTKYGLLQYVKLYDAEMRLKAHYSFVCNNAMRGFMVENVSGERWPLPNGYKVLVGIDGGGNDGV